MSIIYKTTNLVNGKIYIGQHYTSADDGYLGSGIILEKALGKYGKENFKRETIEFCTSANINEKEVYWIDKLDARNPKIGYNISFGGTGGCHFEMTEEIKKKISKNHADFSGENHPLYGIGHKEESKRKISESRKGITPWNKGITKKEDCRIDNSPKSEDFKKTMSQKVFGEKNGMFGKNKYIYYIDGKEIQSLIMFCRENNLNYSGIMGIFYSGRNGYLYKNKYFIERRIK